MDGLQEGSRRAGCVCVCSQRGPGLGPSSMMMGNMESIRSRSPRDASGTGQVESSGTTAQPSRHEQEASHKHHKKLSRYYGKKVAATSPSEAWGIRRFHTRTQSSSSWPNGGSRSADRRSVRASGGSASGMGCLGKHTKDSARPHTAWQGLHRRPDGLCPVMARGIVHHDR
jgi:hypothetical protein